MDFPGRLIAGILAVILLVLFPLQYIARLNSESIDDMVDEGAHKLSDAIRDRGCLDKQTYEDYVDFLDATGDRYDIEIQDIKPVKSEEYSESDITKPSRRASFERMAYGEIFSFAIHVHTDACYDGDKHVHTSQTGACYTWVSHTHSGNTSSGGACYSPNYHSHSGNSSSGGGCYGGRNYHSHSGSSLSGGGCYGGKNYHSHTSSCKHTHDSSCYSTHDGYYTGATTRAACPTCGRSNVQHIPHYCGTCDAFLGTRIVCASCGTSGFPRSHTGLSCGKNTSSYYCGKTTSTVESYYINCNKTTSTVVSYYINCNKSTSTVESYYLNCSKTGVYNLTCTKIPGEYYKGNTKVVPICHQVVTSITATNPTQTVIKGSPIITTATATYLDGHTGSVNCTSNFNTNLIGTQTVTLTYSGLVGNAKTTGTRTCTVNVTVKPDKNLLSITVTPASQTIQRYTQPSFMVRANYSDGTNKVLNSTEYSVAGFNSVNIGLQNVTISHVDNSITKSATVTVMVTAVMRECPKCHNIYELNPDDTDPSCPFCANLIVGIEVKPDYVEASQGEVLSISVYGVYNDGSMKEVTGWTSNYNPLRLGLQIVTVEYGGYGASISVWVSEELMTCPICSTKYPISEVNCPICAEKVVSISASPREITVYQYEAITLTVTATYATGDTREVSDWSIDRTTTEPGTFTATVNYMGVTDTITLTVLSVNSIECPICETIYDISKNPKGCPICSGDVIGIEAYLTSGSNMVQLGTMPNIAVILIFRDDHREFARDGYTLEDYNSNELGIQTVRVVYKEFTTSIVVEVVNMLDTITCPNGHVYHKNKDDMESGCPFCNIGEDISKIAYFDITYTSEILEAVYSLGEYRFMEGNYISVIVTKKDKSLLYRLQNTFFRTSMLGSKKQFIYGGEVY